MSDFPPPPPPSGFPPPPPPGPFGAPPPPGYTTTYGTPATLPTQYAGIGARLGALLLDGLLVGMLFIPAIVVIANGPTKITTCSIDDQGNVTIGEEINGICEVPTVGTIAAAVLLGLVALAGGVLYHTFMVGGTGQTLGRKATGVRVVDATTGAPIGNGRALGRYLFAVFVSSNVCVLGYLWALWDQRKQTWHDKVVSSVVVRA
jgi:uncharacterized RDD family membrane protein YckC